MEAKHECEIQISHALQASNFVFNVTSTYIQYDRIEEDGRTLKFYAPEQFIGHCVHFMNIYSGQITSFEIQLDNKHDDILQNNTFVAETSIIGLELEQFNSVNFALFSISETGLYLSKATLNKSEGLLQIDRDNRTLIAAGHLLRFQLLKLDEQTGLIAYDFGTSLNDSNHHEYQIFRIMETEVNENRIELLNNYFRRGEFLHRIVPRVLNGHAFYFNKFGAFIDFDYLNGTFYVEDKLTPTIKDQGAWYEDNFYFLYRLEFSILRWKKKFEFGVFSMETKRFSILKLPDSIPSTWKYWLEESSDFCPFIVIDNNAILNILPMDGSKRRYQFCKPSRKDLQSQMCLIRIPLRRPETLANLTYLSFLGKSLQFQQRFQPIINNFYPDYSKPIVKLNLRERDLENDICDN